MKTTRKPLSALLLLLLSACLASGEEEKALSSKARLQKALFAEEAERDLAAAAREYERLVEEYSEARQVGLSALYRLAEVRRKQERNEEAAALYQRVVAEFPESAEARLSRENLTALGIAIPGAPDRIPDDPDETKELRRLMLLAKNSPEQVWDEVPLALNDTGSQTTSPLSKAARRGWLRVISFLADQHQKTGREQRELDRALSSAADEGQIDSCRLLAQNGATPASAKRALVGAILNQHQAVAHWLVEQKVDVNAVGQGYLNNLEGRTKRVTDHYLGEEVERPHGAWVSLPPLGAAIATNEDEWIDRLLELGADVNYAGTEQWKVDISPLSIACWKGKQDLVKRLLELGADPNVADDKNHTLYEIRLPASPAEGWRPLHYAAGKPEIVALLLAAGANPQGADSQGYTPLHAAAQLNAAKSCEHLLKAGAASDPAAKLPWLGDKECTPIMLAAAFARSEDQGASAKAVIQLLRKEGADLTPEEFASWDMPWASPWGIGWLTPVSELRVWLAEEIRYPGLAREKAITLELPVAYGSQPLIVPSNYQSSPPPLAMALLTWTKPISVRIGGDCQLKRGNVVRINAEGEMERIPFQLLDPKTHPKLRWGDLIEFLPDTFSPPQRARRSKPGSFPLFADTSSVHFETETYLQLLSRVEVKVSVVWPDRPGQELTLKGGLRVYDPGRPEAPLVPPRILLELLGGSGLQSVQITRSRENGGRTIDLPLDSPDPSHSSRANGIRFLDGDVMTVERADRDQLMKDRSARIELVEPASDFRWGHWVPREKGVSNQQPPRPSVYPTLLQFLTEFYLPVESAELAKMNHSLADEEDFTKWNPGEITKALWQSGTAPWATIRHPDLREIWIDRLDGSRVCFPLAELIAKTNEETPDEFYRQADLELRAGDVVEIPILSDQQGKPWSGFDPEVNRFIQKALSYTFRTGESFKDGISHTVKWNPPHCFETEAGMVAIGGTKNFPFIMNVDQWGHAKIGKEFHARMRKDFKWALPEKWLRNGVLIDPSLAGNYPMARKSRVGSYEKHLGLDERGLHERLGPLPRRYVPRSPPRRNGSVPLPPSR